jgi:Protein of unknown function (DUF1415)
LVLALTRHRISPVPGRSTLAKVLVVDSDSVFAAVLADRLHVAGHEVRRLSRAPSGTTARILDRAIPPNYTNRSPYPTLHLLREASVEKAVAAVPDAAEIYERNMETLRRLGVEGWRRLGIGVKTSGG